MQGCLFFGGEADFYDLLHAAGAELYGDADAEAVDAVFALEIGAGGQDALLVQQHGFHHLGYGSGRCIVGAALFQELHDFAAALAGAAHQLVHLFLGHQLTDGDAADGGVAHQGHHVISVAPQNVGLDVFDRHVHFLRDKGAEAGGVEDPSHAEDALPRKSAGLVDVLHHSVQWVCDGDDDAVGRVLHHLLSDGAGDAHVGEQQVIAAHSGAASNSGGDDHDIGTGGLFVAVAASDEGVGAEDWSGFQHVQRLALGQVFYDVDYHHVGVAQLVNPLCGGCADVPRADYGYLVSHWLALPPLWGS